MNETVAGSLPQEAHAGASTGPTGASAGTLALASNVARLGRQAPDEVVPVGIADRRLEWRVVEDRDRLVEGLVQQIGIGILILDHVLGDVIEVVLLG